MHPHGLLSPGGDRSSGTGAGGGVYPGEHQTLRIAIPGGIYAGPRTGGTQALGSPGGAAGSEAGGLPLSGAEAVDTPPVASFGSRAAEDGIGL